MNKKIVIIILILVMIIGGVVAFVMYDKYLKIDVTFTAGNVIEIKDEKIEKVNNPQWVAEDTSIIDIIDGKLVGVSVGVTSVAAMHGEELVEEYRVEITPSPIESIKLLNEKVLPVGTSAPIKYKISPVEAEENGVIITVDDESVAVIKNGKIKGVSAGVVNITLSNGSGYEESFKMEIVDSPYALLTSAEKEFVDEFKTFRTYYWFNDPENLRLLAVEKLQDGWVINYRTSDGEEKTMMWNDTGSVQWFDSLYATHNGIYNLEKINKALDEVYIDTRK